MIDIYSAGYVKAIPMCFTLKLMCFTHLKLFCQEKCFKCKRTFTFL